jgi:hypothetical protein
MPTLPPQRKSNAMNSVGAEGEAGVNPGGRFGFGSASGLLRPRLSALWSQPRRSRALILALGAAVLFIAFLTLTLPGRAATLLLDYPSRHFIYPLTIQDLMHVIFFVGLGELFVRWRIAVRESEFLRAKFLPEDDRTVLLSRDLGPITRRVANLFDHDNGFLPSLINLAILQFQSSSSVEQAAGVMSQQLELTSHRVAFVTSFLGRIDRKPAEPASVERLISISIIEQSRQPLGSH